MFINVDKSLIINTIKEEYSFKKDAEFARFLDIKPQTLASWHSRNTFDIELLYAKCELIDGNFLLSGKGNVLRNASISNKESDVKSEIELEIERLKDKNSDLQTINELLTRTIADLDKRNSSVQYIAAEPTIFETVAEPKPELKKSKRTILKNNYKRNFKYDR